MGLLGTVPWRSGITQREDHRDKDEIHSQFGVATRQVEPGKFIRLNGRCFV